MMTVTPVGRLACQRDASLKTLKTRVASIAPHRPPKASSAAEEGLVEVVLEDSILFPTGGGQPNDLGTIAGIPVVDVVRRGVTAVHVLRSLPSDATMSVGDEVVVELDFERRWDHMQQHSGQHLLSAVMDTMNLPTVSWSLGKDRCSVEVDYSARGAEPTSADLQAIESRVNALIRENLPFRVLESTSAALKSMPTDLVNNSDETLTIRTVIISGLDENPCCGTHVNSTANLQCLKLLGTEKIRKNLRIFFVFGERVFTLFQESLDRDRALVPLLNAGPELFIEKVGTISKQLRDSMKLLKNSNKELADFIGQKLYNIATSKAAEASDGAGAARVFLCHREDNDMDFLTTVASRLVDIKDATFVLSTSTTVLVVGPEELSSGVWKTVAEVMGGDVKGGGKAGKYQGKVSSWSKRKALVQRLSASEC